MRSNNLKSADKKTRWRLLRQIINEGKYETKDEITDALNKKLKKEGMKTSKASVHRDCKKLGIEPDPRGYYSPTEKTEKIKFRDRLDKSKEYITSFKDDPKLLSFKTREGYAESIAHELEKAYPDMVFGTLASGNTVLVILNNKDDYILNKLN